MDRPDCSNVDENAKMHFKSKQMIVLRLHDE